MDRIINVKVGGNHLSKDNKNAGVRGEGNVTRLRITFDEGWDGYAKTVTFFDAHGNNPVKRVETVDLIEDIENDARTYLTPIPPEAMTVAGELTFVIDGYLDGKRQRSFADTLVVKDAPIADNAGEPTDATPTEPEQWQTQIDTMMGTIQEAFVAKGEAVQARDEAVTAKNVSEANAKEAKFMADRAEGLSVAAQGSVLEAEEYAKKAEENAKKAEDTLGKTNYIGDNGNWYAWDSSIGAFYDTGVKAQSGSTVYLGDNPPADADVWIDLDGEEDTTQDIDAHMSNTDIHTTAEEKLVASEAYDLAREAKQKAEDAQERVETKAGEKYLVDDITAGGEIFNDYENNKAVSEYSHASGSNTHAGHYAFSFKEHEYTEADYDTTNNIGKYYLNTVEGITVGLNYTIVLNHNFGYQGVVNSVGEDYIEVSNYLIPNSDSTKTIYYDSSYIIFPDKPTIQGDMLIGYAAHSEGYSTNAMGISSHAEGGSTIASGQYSHAEGRGSKAGGYASHAETSGQALGHGSHAEGGNTKATGVYSHAEGSYTNATGSTSHAEGESCLAAGKASHAEGLFAKAHGEAQHVQGRYNVIDYENNYAHIVGNGDLVTGEDGKKIRALSNAHTLDWDGNAWFAGDVVAGDISLQSLMPTVITSGESTIVYNFSNRKNKVSQEDEIISISFDFGNKVYDRLYGSELSFDSGATPTAIDYTDSGILNWVGTDCVTSDGLSIFQPSANTHYDIVFYFNGKQFIGLVNGYVPAGGNGAI